MFIGYSAFWARPIDHEGAIPAFKGLYGFTGSICASINHEIVHGIPSPKRVLKDGDIVSLDVGVGYKGYFTDSAATFAVGNIDAKTARLLDRPTKNIECSSERQLSR